MSTALFDIGGTKTRVTVSRDGKTFRRPLVYATPHRYAEGIRQLVDATRTVADGWKISRVVGCIAAPLDATHSRTVHTANLHDWYRSPITADLHRLFRVPTLLENDAAMAGLGEAVHGAGRRSRIVAYIGFGTGIGGARIVDQKIDVSAQGFEPGHHILDWNMRTNRNPLSHAGDWESFVSGAGIRTAIGKKSEHITSARVWHQAEERVAIGLINVTMFWSPEVIVLGGSLMKKMSLTNITTHFRKRMNVFPNVPIVKRAALGDYSGLYGGLVMSKTSRLR